MYADPVDTFMTLQKVTLIMELILGQVLKTCRMTGAAPSAAHQKMSLIKNKRRISILTSHHEDHGENRREERRYRFLWC